MEVQPRHTDRRTQTQWQSRECQLGQPPSATLTARRRRLLSCHDYTAGKSGLALKGPSVARCALSGVKQTSSGRYELAHRAAAVTWGDEDRVVLHMAPSPKAALLHL